MPFPDNEKTEVHQTTEGEGFPCLEVVSGPRSGGRYVLRPGKNQIGRADESDIVLDDSSVSRKHAIVEVTDQGTLVPAGRVPTCRVTDLGSRNGTKIDGHKISQTEALKHGAKLKLGSYQFLFLTHADDTVVGDDVPGEPPTADSVEQPPPSGEPPTGEYEMSEPPAVVQDQEEALPAEVAPEMAPNSFLPEESHPSAPKNRKWVFHLALGIVFVGVLAWGGSQVWKKTQKLLVAQKILPPTSEDHQKAGQVGGVVSSTPSPLPVAMGPQPFFLEFSSTPISAQIYFGDQPIGVTPFRISTNLTPDKWYEARAVFQLTDINETLEERRSRQLGASQTFLDEVIYRREFVIDGEHTNYSVEVNDEAVSTFPVEIRSVPIGAQVIIDDKAVGRTPFTGTFPVGEHLMTLKLDGYFDFVQPIKIDTNMPYVAEIPLKTSEAGELINKASAMMSGERYAEALPILVEAYAKNPAPREVAQISYLIGTCYLRQKSYKEAQDYFLKSMQHDDFKYPGRLGIATLTYEQGDQVKALQYLVEVLVSSSDPKVKADAGSLFQRMSPLKSILYVASDPSGARVLVNGTEASQVTPLILHDVGVGSYRIQVMKEGYESFELTFNMGVSEFKPIVATLKKAPGRLP
ncbi:MAG: PEGA domain-containing protein [Deltaproteobacteria bacterium]|nr:PEGA domain-containing protein [Deltaproteobacteria bacterium]